MTSSMRSRPVESASKVRYSVMILVSDAGWRRASALRE